MGLKPEGTERRLAAILFTDLEGSTAIMGTSEEAGLRAKERHRELVRRQVGRYHGRLVENPGDQTLSIFANALDAVNCALAIQEGTREQADLRLHVGIHLGDVLVRGGEVHGDGVNIAARLCTLSEGGRAFVSAEVFQSVRNQPNVEAAPMGEHDLKNVGRPVSVFALSGHPAAPAPRQEEASGAARGRLLPRAIAAAAAVLVVLAGAGWWLSESGPASAGPIRSLAVLPLDNLSDDPEQEYFTDGLTEALITDLAKLRSLHVISRTSTMRYKGYQGVAGRSLPEIARELNVDGIVEGSVLRAGDSVRITVQLIDARTDHHVWSENYQRDLRDVLALQGQVASAIARQIELELSPGEERRLAKRRPVDPEVQEAYLKGRYFLHKETPATARKAVQYFEKAIRLDPDYALAYSGLADTLSCTPAHAWTSDGSADYPHDPEAVLEKARSNALKALELDDTLAEAHNSMALVQAFGEWDWATGEENFKRALELDPSYWWPHYGYGLLLSITGRHDQGLMQRKRAIAIEPLHSPTIVALGEMYARKGDYEKATAQWEMAQEIDPVYPRLHQSLGPSFCREGMPERTIDSLERAVDLSPDDPLIVADLGYCYATSGREDEARVLLAQLEAQSERGYVSPMGFALIHVGLEELDETFEWLEKAYETRAFLLPFIGLDLTYEPLRSDPRFADLLRRMNIPPPELANAGPVVHGG
jgi:TolB-like protein/class 3 adenylate cyclase/Tfp pilus assembly protein PilF